MNRTLVAFLVAPLVVPAFMLFYLRGLSSTDFWQTFSLVVSVIVAYTGVWVLGFPTYLFLRARQWTSFWLAPVLGFVIGAAMMLVFGVGFTVLLGHSLVSAVSDVMRDPNMLRGALWQGGVAGAATGAVFWLIARPDR